MADDTNFLAVDLGASSGRVMLGRWDGARLGLQELHRFPNAPVTVLGHLHWDVLRLWSEIKIGLAVYARQSDAPLAGLAVDSWAIDFGLLDQQGHLLGNPYAYRDPRTEGVPERVFARVPRETVFAQTGIQILRINTLYQLASMVETGDPTLDHAATLLLIPDLLHYWLTGRKAVEYTNATTTQFFDARTGGWATGLLDSLDIPHHFLPPIVQPGRHLGNLLPQVAAEVGLSHRPPVIATATHDTASAVAAIPDLDARSAYISSGTWSLVGIEVDQPVLDERALALNVTNEGGVNDTIRLLKNVMGLWLLQECQRVWQRQGMAAGWDDLLRQAQAAPPLQSLIDPDAPDFLAPPDMPAAIRAYCQRTDQPTPGTVGAVVRCCLESLALKYRWVVEQLEGLTGRRVDTVRVVGGGSQNATLCQWTADACGRRVVAGPVEATALGNMLVQAIATGHLPSLAAGRAAVAASVTRQTYEPRATERWEAALARVEALVRR